MPESAMEKIRRRAATLRIQSFLRMVKGYRVGVFGWQSTNDYIRTMASSKAWLATTESGDHVGTRFYEVMMSGRAMLMCDRAPEAYAAIGLVEDVHAVMFNTSEEFQAKFLTYQPNTTPCSEPTD